MPTRILENLGQTLRPADSATTSAEAEMAQCGDRLASELRSVIDTLPASSRSARGMCAHLGIDRNTCQKVLAASRAARQAVLVTVPGPKGLDQFAEASLNVGVDKARVRALHAAIASFRAQISHHGGTHSALRQAVSSIPAASTRQVVRDRETLRREHFETSAELLGLSVDANISLAIFSEANSPDQQRLSLVGARASLGCIGREGGVPLTVSVARAMNPDQTHAGQLESFVLEDFSTRPLPVLAWRRPEGSTTDVLDLAGSHEPGRAIDAVIGTRLVPTVSPRGNAEQVLACTTIIRQPTRRMIVDVFVERPLAAGRIPSANGFLWNIRLELEESANRWFDKLPDALRLEVLGPGLAAVDNRIWPRHVELYNEIFRANGLDPSKYIGYRLDLRYPITGTNYRVALDRPELSI